MVEQPPVRRGPPPSPKTAGAVERIKRGEPGTMTTEARPGVRK